MQEFMEFMTEYYGDDIGKRVAKLKEECLELQEAGDNMTFGNYEDFIDELADVNVVVAHINHISGMTYEELINIAQDKIVKRLKNPDYKRKHPHIEST